MVASIGRKNNFYFHTGITKVHCAHDDSSRVSLTLTTQVNQCDNCGDEFTTEANLWLEDVVLADGRTVMVATDNGKTLEVEVDRVRRETSFRGVTFPVIETVKRSDIVALAGTAQRGALTH